LLLFLNEDLRDQDIPHRTKLTQLIEERYKIEYVAMVQEIQNSLGRVSFTSDLWSNQTIKGFMAVTAHYCSEDAQGHLILHSHLV
ncbi:hypothetical protein PAXINDRAFT_26351, partial [Paxillus involutus ATCC 200175]